LLLAMLLIPFPPRGLERQEGIRHLRWQSL